MNSDDLDRSSFLILLLAVVLLALILTRRGDSEKAKG